MSPTPSPCVSVPEEFHFQPPQGSSQCTAGFVIPLLKGRCGSTTLPHCLVVVSSGTCALRRHTARRLKTRKFV